MAELDPVFLIEAEALSNIVDELDYFQILKLEPTARPDEIKAAYAAELKETIILRRYTGTGSNRIRFDASARGRAWG